MNIDNDYDEDGNNIVPCPICLSVYCPSKEGGKCPEEDEYVKSMTPSKETLEAKKTFVEEQKKIAKKEIDTLVYHKKGVLSGTPYSDEIMRGENMETVTLVKKEDVYLVADTIINTTINNTLAEVEREVEEYKIAGGNYNCGEEDCCDTNPTDEREKWDIGEQIAYNTALANIKARIQEMIIK
jgi:hypothetical protein